MSERAIKPIEQLLEIMRQLRHPETGCAWDLKQSFESIAPYTLEEAYEVVDAIERGDMDDVKDELGDLLLQVIFHAQMASEQNLFDFDDVVRGISEKMIRRHPHVFSDRHFASEAELKAAWETIKQEERKAREKRRDASAPSNDTGQSDLSASSSFMDGVAVNLPSLQRADKLQTRAARAGFDWKDINPVWEALNEEIDEVKVALKSADTSAIEDEVGDLLFTVVNLARHARVDAEMVLRQACGKFERRVRMVEQLAARQNRTLSLMSEDELDDLWVQAKRLLVDQ